MFRFITGGALLLAASFAFGANGATADAAKPAETQPMTIYDTALAPGWENWSCAKAELGVELGGSPRRPIRIVAQGWEALYLHHAPFSTTGLKRLSFLIQGSVPDREVRVFALTDGKSLEILPAAEDHKTIFDGDKGPNTGGMGTVSPAWANEDLMTRIKHEILEPTVRGLAADGIDYRGVLFAGVMVDAAGAPWLLEYNCRFGDPETQPIMARLVGDLGAVLAGAARGEMPHGKLGWDARVAVCVVVAAAGYPGDVRTGDAIGGLDRRFDDVVVFHAGTARKDGQLVTAGGRVLGVTALGVSTQQARERAYAVVDSIDLPGKQVRRDIGARVR